MTAVAPGIVKTTEVDFYAFAFKDINFTSSAFLACWSFIEITKPVDAFSRQIVAQRDIIKE